MRIRPFPETAIPSTIAMHATDSHKPPAWFYLIGGIALLWNLMGLMMFAIQMTMSQDSLAALPEDQRALYESMPTWVMIAFAVAVICGTLGSVALVLRKPWSILLFGLSLIGVAVQATHTMVISNAIQVMGQQALIMPTIIALIALFLVLFSVWSRSRGWMA